MGGAERTTAIEKERGARHNIRKKDTKGEVQRGKRRGTKLQLLFVVV